MEDQIFNAILADTYTARNLGKRLRVLKLSLLKQIFGAVNNIGDASELEEEKDWLATLGSGVLSQINKDNIYPLFKSLDERVKKIEVLTVYVPVDLEKSEITRIGTILRKDYGPAFIFDIKFDPNVIGGAALVWKGIYKDYSIRALMGQRKNEILTEFRKFIGR